jgi:hypothetical protein
MNNGCFKKSSGRRTVCGTPLIFVLAGLSIMPAAYAQGQRPGPPPTPGAAGAYPHAHSAPPVVPPATSGPAPVGRKTSAGEQFYIVASLDQSKSQLLLKLPSEVTMLMSVTGTTQIQDENGASLKLSDLRAGDTVWVVSSGGAQPTAVHIRKGQMTIADLHRYYLDYPEIK